jgi:hypothetical protein
VRKDEGYGLAGIDHKLTDRFEIFAVQSGWGTQNQTHRAGNRIDGAILGPANPGYGCSIVETHHKFGAEHQLPRPPNHDAYEVSGTV